MKITNPVVPTLRIHPAILVKRKPDNPEDLKLWTPPSAKHISSRYVQFIVLDDPEFDGKVILVQPGCFFETDIAEQNIWFMWKRDVLAVLTPDEDEEIRLTNGKGKFLGEENEMDEIELKKQFDQELLNATKPVENKKDAPTIIIKSAGGITQ